MGSKARKKAAPGKKKAAVKAAPAAPKVGGISGSSVVIPIGSFAKLSGALLGGKGIKQVTQQGFVHWAAEAFGVDTEAAESILRALQVGRG